VIGLGTTLRCELPPRHIWVVLSDPAATGGVILMVNMTTLRESCVDDACVLGPEDYVLLTRATTIAYSRAQAGPAAALEGLVRNGQFISVENVPARTLAKIIAGARRSPQLSPAHQRLLPKE
jgi:hypothetical protein